MHTSGFRAVVTALVAALAITLMAPNAVAVPATGAVVASTPTAGAVVPVAPSTGWARSATVSTAAGQNRELALWTGRGAPDAVQGLLVQVQADASTPGTATLSLPGSSVPVGEPLDLVAGRSSSTVIVRPDGTGRITVGSSVPTRLAVTVVATISAVAAGPGAGGTQLVDPTVVVDQASGLGGAVPGAGGTLTVPLAGIAGIPVAGARAVWLSVRSTGAGNGALAFPSADGTGASVVTTRPRPRTDLVFAELDERGDLAVAVRGAATASLAITVVGWVADGSSTGALVPVRPAPLRWTSGLGSVGQLTLTGGAVPPAASDVLVKATITTGLLPGHAQIGTSLLGSLLAPALSVPLGSAATTDLTLAVPVGPTGQASVVLPAGARLVGAVALGYVGTPVAPDSDRTAPQVRITGPNVGEELDQGDDPLVTFTGTARDTGSGVRTVTLAAGQTALGEAHVRPAGDGSVTWSLEVAVPAGRHTVTATAVDWAGRQSVARRAVTVTAPGPEAIVVAPTTRILDGSGADTVLEVGTDQVVLAGATEIRAGDVIVSGVSAAAPEGFLRHVHAVTVVDGRVVLRTTQAALTDAVLQADVSVVDLPLDGDDMVLGPDGQPRPEDAWVALLAPRSAAPTRATDVEYTFSKSVGELKLANGNLTASSDFRFTLTLTFELDIDMNLDWSGWDPQVKTFRFESTAATSLVGKLEATTKVEVEHEVPLSRVRLGAVTVPVGPVPVVLTSSLAPTAYFEVSGKTTLGFSVTATGSGTTGFAYRDGEWEPISDHEWTFEPKPVASLAFTAGAGVRFGLDLKIWDVAGPVLRLSAGPALTSTIDLVQQKVTTKAGVDVGVELGIKIEVLSHALADNYIDLGTITLPLGEWTVDFAGDDPGTEPGDPGTDPGEPGTDPGGPGTGPGDPGTQPGGPGDGAGPPTVTDLWPSVGTPEGLEDVEISGDDLSDVVGVTFGGVPARSFHAYSGMIVAVTPEHAPGAVDVVVTTSTGQSEATQTSTFLFQDPGATARYRDLDISPNHVIAVLEDGTVHASGSSSSGQLGVPGAAYGEQLLVPGLSDVVQAAAGHQHSLAVTRSGEVYAWGSGAYGQLGLGTTDSAASPQRVPGLPRVVDVVAAGHTSVALGADGSVWTWGVLSSVSPSGPAEGDPVLLSPARAEGLPAVVSVAVGGWFSDGSHVLALASDGTVWAWGDNDRGQLGDGTTVDRYTPAPVPGLAGIAAVTAGEDLSVVLASDGTVRSWGRNDEGQLGLGDTVPRAVPTVVPGLPEVQQLSAGRQHVLALDSGGAVWSWGSGDYYQVRLPQGEGFGSLSPVADTRAPRGAAVIAGSGYISAVVSPRGGIWVWGEQTHSGSTAIQRGGRIAGWWVDPV